MREEVFGGVYRAASEPEARELHVLTPRVGTVYVASNPYSVSVLSTYTRHSNL